jgi:rhomboid protease GluP
MDMYMPSKTKLVQKFKDVLDFITIKRRFVITPILVFANAFIYILTIVDNSNYFVVDQDVLVKWGANFQPYTLNAELWRLLTSNFLHFTHVHLMSNMVILIFLGLLLEPVLGKSRFLLAYLLSAIASSTVGLIWNELLISAGASGAIFGLLGVSMALFANKLIENTSRRTFFIFIIVLMLLNIIVGIRDHVGNFAIPGSVVMYKIDYSAHISGFISGFLIGLAFVPSLKSKKKSEKHYSSALIGIVVTCICIQVCGSLKPYEIDEFNK